MAWLICPTCQQLVTHDPLAPVTSNDGTAWDTVECDECWHRTEYGDTAVMGT